MTTETQIAALEEALSSGAKTITIGDRTISYRSTEEIYQILASLRKKSSGSTTPFSVSYIKPSTGL